MTTFSVVWIEKQDLIYTRFIDRRASHFGVDFVCGDDDVIAIADGIVHSIEEPPFGGEPSGTDTGASVYVDHYDVDGLTPRNISYTHLQQIVVVKGQRVRRGQLLGRLWQNPDPDSRWKPHVHLEVNGFQLGSAADPLRYVTTCLTTATPDQWVFPVRC